MRILLAALLAAQVAGASAVIAASRPPAAEIREVRVANLAGPRGDELADRVRAEAGAAVGAVERFWGTDWPRAITVIITGSADRFALEARLDPGSEWGDIAAVTVADQVDPVRRQASGQRIVLAPGASAMTDEDLRIVLTHELFHLAARTGTALDAPRWLTEGVADFVARPPAPLPAGAAADTSIPSDAELDIPGPERSTGYDRAWWFARFVADSFGIDGLRRLYDRACGPGHSDLAAAVRDALGTDLSELQVRWAGWLTG